MPTESQLKDYFNRSGDTELSHGEIEENSNGFCVWRVSDEAFILVHVYGNGRYWDNWATNKAKELGLNKIMFGTIRNPDLFKRRSKFDYKVSCYILERAI